MGVRRPRRHGGRAWGGAAAGTLDCLGSITSLKAHPFLSPWGGGRGCGREGRCAPDWTPCAAGPGPAGTWPWVRACAAGQVRPGGGARGRARRPLGARVGDLRAMGLLAALRSQCLQPWGRLLRAVGGGAGREPASSTQPGLAHPAGGGGRGGGCRKGSPGVLSTGREVGVQGREGGSGQRPSLQHLMEGPAPAPPCPPPQAGAHQAPGPQPGSAGLRPRQLRHLGLHSVWWG